jgi:hypothetical protein
MFPLDFPERRIKSALLGGPLEGSSHFFGANEGTMDILIRNLYRT